MPLLRMPCVLLPSLRMLPPVTVGYIAACKFRFCCLTTLSRFRRDFGHDFSHVLGHGLSHDLGHDLGHDLVRHGRDLGHALSHRGRDHVHALARQGRGASRGLPQTRPPPRSPCRCRAGVKCTRRSCARRQRRHLNCARRSLKLRTPYRTLHTCSVRRVQYGVHNSRILTPPLRPQLSHHCSFMVNGEPACPPPSSVG